MKPTVVIMTLPLTPVALFGYGILRFLGQIDEEAYVRFTRTSSHHSDLFSCEENVVDLRLREGGLYSQVSKLVELNHSLKRALSFASFGNTSGENREVHTKLGSVLRKLNTANSREALHLTSQLIKKLADSNSDIWKSTKSLEILVENLESLVRQPQRSSYPGDKRILSLPVFQKKNGVRGTENDITNFFEVVLEEGRICSLQEKHISLVVGGPSGSGKSTLAVSIMAEMRNCIRTLQSRSSFADLELNVGLFTLDIGTPTTRAIAEGWGNDRERLERLKQPWSMKLAERLQRAFLESRDRCNITVADLPGRVTDITKMLVAPADAAIIISNDWSVMQQEWEPLMKELGVPVISKIRKRNSDEGVSSIVTSWQQGERLSGRVTALNRTQKSWDLFIQWLALFLLFDILPNKFGEEDIT